MTTTIKKITEDKLKTYLEKIGWSIKGNSLNRCIVNDYGELTNFYIEGGYDGTGGTRIEIRKQPFGRSFSGSFQLDFSDMWLQYMNNGKIEDTFISLVFPKENTTKGCKSFISFYPTKMRDQKRSNPHYSLQEK